MSEAYQQKEWELNSLMDNLNSIEYTYEEYKKEVEHFIDRLLEDTKEINVLRNQLKQKENIIKEVREYIEEWQRFPHTNGSTHKELKNLIDILDKENNNE